MAWTTYQLLLSMVVVITGSINTLGVKWADEVESIGKGGQKKKFTHPFFQTFCLFFGELCCLITFKILCKLYSLKVRGTEDIMLLTKGNRNFNPLIFLVPVVCDIAGMSLMYIGLNLTYPASFQRLRGSAIIFVCLFSICFLKIFPNFGEWCGLFLIIVGLTLGGITDFLSTEISKECYRKKIITGYILVVCAQIMTSIHMVFEEKFVTNQDIPSLQAVGWEGLFGFSIMIFLLLPLYFIRAGPPVTQKHGDRMEDTIEALIQMCNNWQLPVAITGTIVSIAFFNFAGISVTKELSATTRMVVASVRTIIVWIFSLALFGQQFHWLQPVGFTLLIIGTCLYGGVIPVSTCSYIRCGQMENIGIGNRRVLDNRSCSV